MKASELEDFEEKALKERIQIATELWNADIGAEVFFLLFFFLHFFLSFYNLNFFLKKKKAYVRR